MYRSQDEGHGPAPDLVWMLARDVFWALSVTCVLCAAHRIAAGLLLGSRVKALQEYGAAYTPEEREVLIRKIKRGSLGC